jgi:hypothetical protein
MAALWIVGLFAGCGTAPSAVPTPQPPAQSAAPARSESRPREVAKQPAPALPRASAFWDPANSAKTRTPARPERLLPQRQIDEAKVAAAGIRKLSGKHLTLYTDLPSQPEIDSLCSAFDQAYGQWCAYFHVSPEEEADWRMTGYLMKDKPRFESAGLYPDNLPEFKYGFARDNELWLYEQPNDYYRRHLLLHEGTHGFMYTRLRGSGPPWYMEGVAELLGTHRWQNGKLEMGHFPAHRDETPLWGRIKIVQDGFAQAKALFLEQILSYPVQAHLETEAYGWCWAAAAFFQGHPRYRDRFDQATKLVGQPDFSEQFRQLYADDWNELTEEWQLYIAGLEYGYDLTRAAVEFAPGEVLPKAGATVNVLADRGWQSSKLRLEAGTTYRLKAKGRYQVAQQPKPWDCEPGGVSIRYYKGQPLGILMACMRPDDREPGAVSGMFRTAVVGLGTTLSPLQSGTLYLRINDSAAELADNAGSLEVQIEPIATAP